jgi:DNA polymerase-3 subunit alpha
MAGAFDSFGVPRSVIVKSAEQLVAYSKTNYVDILPSLVLPDIRKETTGQRLAWEKELLGLYASSNPAKNYYELVRKHGTIDISQLPEAKGDFIKIGGVVSDFRKTLTKNGKTLYFIRIHDTSGFIEVPIFAGVYNKHKDAIANNNILILSGKIDNTREKNPFVCLGVKQIGSMVE